LNVEKGMVRLRLRLGVATMEKYIDLYKIVDDRSKIYDNGGAQVYH